MQGGGANGGSFAAVVLERPKEAVDGTRTARIAVSGCVPYELERAPVQEGELATARDADVKAGRIGRNGTTQGARQAGAAHRLEVGTLAC